MSPKVYRSNISPVWTKEQQDALLPEGTVYEDEINKPQRRSKKIAYLKDRAELLRPTNRRGLKIIVVAALPVLAYDSDDFIYVLKKAAEIGAEIHVSEPKMVFKPSKAYASLHRAAKVFKQAKDALKVFEGGKIGGVASAAKRKAEAEEKAKIIADKWPNPAYTNAHLIKESGVSINTLRRIYGSREKSIRNYKAAQKRKHKAQIQDDALDRHVWGRKYP